MKSQLFYKIKIYCTVYAFIGAGIPGTASAQQQDIIKTEKQYTRAKKQDSLQKMIELRSLVPSIVYDLRYSTKNNFTGQQLYKKGTRTYLRSQPAIALQKIQEELATKGYGLKIFDAYRPFSVTKKMWELVHDERYVANPAKGSGHNRGLSVDLTLVHLKTGDALDMGTDFDNFTDTAHHSFNGLPALILQNRKLLKETMEKFGFQPLATEWWHYSWPNNRNYELMDIDFSKFRN